MKAFTFVCCKKMEYLVVILLNCIPMYGSVIQPGYQICKTWLCEIVNRAAILQGARARQTNAPFINQETVKAVLSQTLDRSKLIIIKDVDVKLNEISRYIYRCLLENFDRKSKM